MAQSESARRLYERFGEYCAEYMRGEDVDVTGVTVIVHPMYRLVAIASKGPFLQKERLGRIVSLFSGDDYEACPIKDIPDLSGSGEYIGTAILKEKTGSSNAASRFLKAVSVFHRPEEELLKTIDESFVMAKLMEFEVLQSGEILIPETRVPDAAGGSLPPSIERLNAWLELIASGGSSTCVLRNSDRRIVLSPFPESVGIFAREFIAVMKDTQDLWVRRPKREDELVSQIEAALSAEKIEAPEEAEEASGILSMGRRESESYFRDKKDRPAEADFDPLDMLDMTPEQNGRNDLTNNRFGMDPFRRMNVNEIFFHSTVL